MPAAAAQQASPSSWFRLDLLAKSSLVGLLAARRGCTRERKKIDIDADDFYGQVLSAARLVVDERDRSWVSRASRRRSECVSHRRRLRSRFVPRTRSGAAVWA